MTTTIRPLCREDAEAVLAIAGATRRYVSVRTAPAPVIDAWRRVVAGLSTARPDLRP